MQWTTDKATEGFCAGPPNMGSIKMKYPSLEEQKEDGNSIYHYIKQIYKLKDSYPEIARGTVTFEEAYSNENVCVMRKEYNGSDIVIVYNISETTQEVSVEGLTMADGNVPELGGVLLTGNETTQLSDGTLIMPAYSVVLLK
jgi:glycosidase